MSRIFTNVDETHTLLTNLFQSLCRSDQDDWLRKLNLARQSSYGAFGSNANLLAARGGVGGIADDGDDRSTPSIPDEKPIRGYSNVAALIAAASPSRNSNNNKNAVTSPSHKFHVGSQPRIAQALRLAGEDQTEQDDSARPRTFAISCSRGAASRNHSHKAWFDELVLVGGNDDEASKNNQNNNSKSNQLLSLESAKKEFLGQEHFGFPNPAKDFEVALQKFAPLAKQRGGLNVDEFTCIFARFDYD